MELQNDIVWSALRHGNTSVRLPPTCMHGHHHGDSHHHHGDAHHHYVHR